MLKNFFWKKLKALGLQERGKVVRGKGFSPLELEESGLSLEQAQALGLPIDMKRVSAYGPNILALEKFKETHE